MRAASGVPKQLPTGWAWGGKLLPREGRAATRGLGGGFRSQPPPRASCGSLGSAGAACALSLQRGAPASFSRLGTRPHFPPRQHMLWGSLGRVPGSWGFSCATASSVRRPGTWAGSWRSRAGGGGGLAARQRGCWRCFRARLSGPLQRLSWSGRRRPSGGGRRWRRRTRNGRPCRPRHRPPFPQRPPKAPARPVQDSARRAESPTATPLCWRRRGGASATPALSAAPRRRAAGSAPSPTRQSRPSTWCGYICHPERRAWPLRQGSVVSRDDRSFRPVMTKKITWLR